MAVTARFYNKFFDLVLTTGAVNLESDTIMAAVVTADYTPDYDAHDYWDDVSANEAEADDYVAGGVELTSVAVAIDAGNNEVEIDAADVADEWTPASPTGRYVIIYDSSVGAGLLICCQDLGDNTTLSGLTFNAEGFGKIDTNPA
jgi:hypothetical protein